MRKIIRKAGLLTIAAILTVAPSAVATMSGGQFGGAINNVNFQVNTRDQNAYWLNSKASRVGARVAGTYQSRAHCQLYPTTRGKPVYFAYKAQKTMVSQGSCPWGINSGTALKVG